MNASDSFQNSSSLLSACKGLAPLSGFATVFNRDKSGVMANILYGICPEGSILDGFDDWPRSATRKEWFRITRQMIQETIADMDLDPAALAEVEEAFIGAGLL